MKKNSGPVLLCEILDSMHWVAFYLEANFQAIFLPSYDFTFYTHMRAIEAKLKLCQILLTSC